MFALSLQRRLPVFSNQDLAMDADRLMNQKSLPFVDRIKKIILIAEVPLVISQVQKVWNEYRDIVCDRDLKIGIPIIAQKISVADQLVNTWVSSMGQNPLSEPLLIFEGILKKHPDWVNELESVESDVSVSSSSASTFSTPDNGSFSSATPNIVASSLLTPGSAFKCELEREFSGIRLNFLDADIGNRNAKAALNHLFSSFLTVQANRGVRLKEVYCSFYIHALRLLNIMGHSE